MPLYFTSPYQYTNVPVLDYALPHPILSCTPSTLCPPSILSKILLHRLCTSVHLYPFPSLCLSFSLLNTLSYLGFELGLENRLGLLGGGGNLLHSSPWADHKLVLPVGRPSHFAAVILHFFFLFSLNIRNHEEIRCRTAGNEGSKYRASGSRGQ